MNDMADMPDRRRLRTRTSSHRAWLAVLLAAALVLGLTTATAAATTSVAGDGARGSYARAGHSLRSADTDENFYFVMADRFANGSTANDTGGLGNDPMVSGFDPTNKGFYNGGDLQGIIDKLDYIQGLGTTAIWLTPSFKNKAVQPQDKSAGYHGYWVTDFTQIDPHLGTNAELSQLITLAHKRGMKVYFDIITNHTADIIGYDQKNADGSTTFSQRLPYTSKDASPYKTASGTTFDDRDYAGTGTFPQLSATESFPYIPVVQDPAEQNAKVPSWLNDVTLYHNRGDTTFTGENSQYGDFYGLDDLFTENPKVVNGFIDVYETWIRDFGIDGFRIDTMKHVDDAFWQQFGPKVLQYARQHGKKDFFMFGEVFDLSRPLTSRYTTHDDMQAVLDFPFQDAARTFASKTGSAADLQTFFAGDDWYTDADSNVYQLPTFLGNHDMGRIGYFLKTDNPTADDATLVKKDQLAHELMYFSRGDPVIYYGDEQGFTGTGGDQDARQSMFASRVPSYLADDLLGTTRTHAEDNYETTHPLYLDISTLARIVRENPTLRDGAMQVRYASDGPGIFAFSRTRVQDQREYVVVTNNATTAQTATIPTYAANRAYAKIYGDGAGSLTSSAASRLTVTVPAMSSVVYKMLGRIAPSTKAPRLTLQQPTVSTEDNSRLHLSATVKGSGLYEVTFQARTPGGRWQNIGTDDNAPYQVYPDVANYRPGTKLAYRAIVLDNEGHTRTTGTRTIRVPNPKVTLTSPTAGSKVRGQVTVQASVDPEKASNVVQLQRRVGSGAWTTIGTDSSSPVYTAVDTVDGLGPEGTAISYRARAMDGRRPIATSPTVTVTLAGPPVTTATVRYHRADADYTGWGLHLWGDGIDPTFLAGISWDKPMPPTRIVDGWAEFDIPLTSDTVPVNFIVHTPSGDSVPDTRELGGDRSFTPLDSPEIWLLQGDATVYTSQPPA